MILGKEQTVGDSASKDAEIGPNARPLRPVGRILMATDLSGRSDRAVERAVELAAQHNAHLTILHVLDQDLPASVQDQANAAARQEIETCLRKAGATGSGIAISIVPGSDHRDIIQQADENKADLIVTGTHRNESRRRPISGTTMERVIRNGRQPVLVVRDRVTGPYERIMVGVDFSVFSRFAIRSGFSLAPAAEFWMVHAFQVPYQGFQPGRDTRRAVQEEHELEFTRVIDEEMNSLLNSSVHDLTAIKTIHKVIRHGDPRSVLRSEVDRLQPDLLVLGTHGRVGISHALLGSVAEEFLNQPPCDVLAVKAW